jgi:hypothetical protein
MKICIESIKMLANDHLLLSRKAESEIADSRIAIFMSAVLGSFARQFLNGTAKLKSASPLLSPLSRDSFPGEHKQREIVCWRENSEVVLIGSKGGLMRQARRLVKALAIFICLLSTAGSSLAETPVDIIKGGAVVRVETNEIALREKPRDRIVTPPGKRYSKRSVQRGRGRG